MNDELDPFIETITMSLSSLSFSPGAEFTNKQNAKQIAKHFAWPSALGAIGIHKTLLS